MAKYHIKPESGEPGACDAKPGNCPYAGDDQHFTSKGAARAHYESTQGSSTPQAVSKFGARKDRRAERYKAVKRTFWNENPATVTAEDLKDAAAYAQINDKFAVAGYYDEKFDAKFDEDWGDDDFSQMKFVRKIHVAMATPDGKFLNIAYNAYVEGEKDDHWNYHPGLEVNYVYSDNPEELANSFNSREMGQKRVPIDQDDVLTITSGNFTKPSYDHWSSEDAARIAHQLSRVYFDPDSIARIARLREANEKISPETLLANDYFGSNVPELRAEVVRRKEFPKTAHAAALADKDRNVRFVLASRADLERPTIDALLAQDDPQKHGDGRWTPRLYLIRGPGLPVSMMRKIARDGSIDEMRSLYKNPNLSDAAEATLLKRAAQLKINLGFR